MVEKEHLIDLVGISKEFDGVQVLKNINLYIRKKEFITLLGPSGCGKTTTLRIIGGFETPSEGQVLFGGQDISALPPYKRRVNTVFQKYALFPHLNVYDNIAFALKLKKLPKKQIAEKVGQMLELVNLKGYEKRHVDALSGGQQQRVAIARSLVNEPEVLLLDEPLGALDLKLRKEMQLELKAMQQRLGITFIFVTHDQEEALTMSDTIVVMKDGTIQQIGDPKTIYDEPANAFVADFIGESNLLRGTMIHDELVEFAGTEFPCVDFGFGENTPVDVVVRPEDIMLVGEDVGQMVGTIKSVLFKGVHYEMMIDTGAYTFKVHSTTMQPQGSRVGLNIVPFNIHIMKRLEDTTPAAGGGCRMLSNLSLPWWAYALMGTGLCVFIALIAITIHRNRGMHRSLFASPYALWMMIFTIVPVILIAYYAFTDSSGAFTLDNFRSFWDSNYESNKIILDAMAKPDRHTFPAARSTWIRWFTRCGWRSSARLSACCWAIRRR